MKQSVIRELSTAELQEKLADEKTRLGKLNLTHAVSPLENPMELRQIRKTIARMLTELNNRDLQEVSN
jgi:large subunit ribosomal protein L29